MNATRAKKTGGRRSAVKPQARAAKGNATRRSHARAHAHHAGAARKWSAHVTETSDAMDVDREIFKSGSADEIAASLKHSATRSHRRKASPFQSAMSMLNFYTNRAGRNLGKSRKQTLQAAKKKLREAFGRTP
ncbi:MAG TPA: DUF3175 domain-containing protein [Herbaspirillum sp.]|jgi:hypothetical protein